MSWYLTVLSKYAVFSGRARRREYWFFFLIHILIVFALVALDLMLGTASVEAGIGLLSGLYSLAVLIPTIAVAVRRLHDSGRSGWWLLVGFVPILGGLAVIVLMLMDSTPGDNQYGPNPKQAFT